MNNNIPTKVTKKTSKVTSTIRIDANIHTELIKLAHKQNRNFTNTVETLLLTHPDFMGEVEAA